MDSLFDLYQITGDKIDLNNIRTRFKSYTSEEFDILKAEDLLKQIYYKDLF